MNNQRRHPVPPHVAPEPAASTWISALANATTEDEVLDICRGYLGELAASQRESLPRDCQPVELEDRTDLSAYALALVRSHARTLDCPPLLASMAEFFALANVRMAKMIRHADDASEADAVLSRMGGRRFNDDPGSQAME